MWLIFPQNVMYVRAIKNYRTRESTLLHFEKGNIIKLTNRNMTMDRGADQSHACISQLEIFKLNECFHCCVVLFSSSLDKLNVELLYHTAFSVS